MFYRKLRVNIIYITGLIQRKQYDLTNIIRLPKI